MKAVLAAALLIFPALASDPLPAEAAKIVEAREAEIHRANLAYAKKLDGLLAIYKKAGDEKNAKAVEDLIAAAEEGKAPVATGNVLRPIVGKWRRDYDRSILEFKADGTGTYNGTTNFTVTYSPKTKRFTLTSDKWVDTVAVTLHADVLKGGHDNKIPYKLNRLK